MKTNGKTLESASMEFYISFFLQHCIHSQSCSSFHKKKVEKEADVILLFSKPNIYTSSGRGKHSVYAPFISKTEHGLLNTFQNEKVSCISSI
jgi:hypothetical protein